LTENPFGIAYDKIEFIDGMPFCTRVLYEEHTPAGLLYDNDWLMSRIKSLRFYDDICAGKAAVALLGINLVVIICRDKCPELQSRFLMKPLKLIPADMSHAHSNAETYGIFVCPMTEYENCLHRP
jgi:hypothetical protein